jgi:hypothetical protein
LSLASDYARTTDRQGQSADKTGQSTDKTRLSTDRTRQGQSTDETKTGYRQARDCLHVYIRQTTYR